MIFLDPWKGEFYSFRVPLPVASDPALSEGAKLLYGALVYHFGKPRRDRVCNPSLKLLASEMGVHVNTVLRWLNELVAEKYIIRTRAGAGRCSEYNFLEHPRFTRSDSPAVVSLDSPELVNQAGNRFTISESQIHQNGKLDSPELVNAYKEETIQETTQETIHPPPQVPSTLRSEEEEESLAREREEFALWMQTVTRADVPPAEADVAKVLSQCPGWSPRQGRRALMIYGQQQQFAPKWYSGFIKPMKAAFEKFNGVPPARRPKRVDPLQPQFSDEELDKIKRESAAYNRDVDEFLSIISTLPKPVESRIRQRVSLGMYDAVVRAAIIGYLRDTAPLRVCELCNCTGFDLSYGDTPSGPMPCKCRFPDFEQQSPEVRRVQ